jgi:hypothetical protein
MKPRRIPIDNLAASDVQRIEREAARRLVVRPAPQGRALSGRRNCARAFTRVPSLDQARTGRSIEVN